MRRSLMYCWLLCVALLVGMAAPPEGLPAFITTCMSDAALKDARIGIYIQSLRDGDIWYTTHAGDAFIPASNTKLITAALALDYLKPEYRYVTRLLADGTITDGVLTGNLVLQGSGDPALTSDDLQALAQALVAGDDARGIPPVHEVRGRLLLDDSFFPRPGPLRGAQWMKEDLPWYYAAPAGALSVHRNAVTVTVHVGDVGKPPVVTLDPPTKLFTVVNTVRTTATGGTATLTPRGHRLYIRGRMKPGDELVERVSVPVPTRFVEEQFRLALANAGVRIGATAKGTADMRRMPVLAEHVSPPVSELVAVMLKESDNHTAEQLRWTLLSLYSLEKPLATRYQAMLQDFAAFSGFNALGIKVADGSGLSRLNRLTPDAAVRILTYMAHTPVFDTFYQALPIAGVDGTMKKRLCNTPAAGNAHIKTGTMTSVSALSGYVTTADNELLVCAIFVNGYRTNSSPARKLQDDIISYLATTPCAPPQP